MTLQYTDTPVYVPEAAVEAAVPVATGYTKGFQELTYKYTRRLMQKLGRISRDVPGINIYTQLELVARMISMAVVAETQDVGKRCTKNLISTDGRTNISPGEIPDPTELTEFFAFSQVVALIELYANVGILNPKQVELFKEILVPDPHAGSGATINQEGNNAKETDTEGPV